MRTAPILLLFAILTLALVQYQAGPSAPPIQASTLPHLSSPVELAPRLRSILTTTPQSTGVGTGSDIQITSDPSNLPQNEPSIAVNPVNSSNLVAAANDYRIAQTTGGAWLGYYTSRDGGQSWSNNLLPGFPGDTTPSVLNGFRFSADPAVAYDNQGNVYLSGIAFNVRGNKAVDGSVFVSRSTDGGDTFTQTRIVAEGDGSKLFHDKSYIALDQSSGPYAGTIYVSWTKFTTTTATILVSYSRNGGLTFSSPVTISVTGSNQGSVPAVGPNGEVYVAWLDFSTNNIRIATSTNGGNTFTTRTVHPVVRIPNPLPNTQFRTNSFPTLNVDPASGNVYVAWADNGNGNADILFTRSTDGGVSWSSPLRVNDDTGTHDQFFSWMAASEGTISVAFYDRRDDPANHDLHVYYARSSDGGISFEPNTRVSDTPINPDINFQGTFIGDYIGIAATGGNAHLVWTDTRNNNQDIFADVVILDVHDVAVTSVVPERTFAYAGITSTLEVNVTARNQGSVAESFTVTLEANSFNIGTLSVNSLAPGVSEVLTFNWDTSTLPKGSYNLQATAASVSGEQNLADNTFTDGTVEVRAAGDVNNDGNVNIIDLATVGAAFGSSPTSPAWNPNADINNDAIVNILDLTIVGSHFGLAP